MWVLLIFRPSLVVATSGYLAYVLYVSGTVSFFFGGAVASLARLRLAFCALHSTAHQTWKKICCLVIISLSSVRRLSDAIRSYALFVLPFIPSCVRMMASTSKSLVTWRTFSDSGSIAFHSAILLVSAWIRMLRNRNLVRYSASSS